MAARKKIEKPENWTKGSHARTLFGEGVGISAPDACKWCAIGAVYAATGANIMLGATADCALSEHTPRGSVVLFNDAADTKHEDVLALFDAVIASEKEKEALAA